MAPTDTKRKLEDAGLEKTEEGLSKRPKATEITKGQKECTYCTTSDDKLEIYLEDIFLKYCRISINEKEVDFIRNGVETLTLEYLQKTYRNSPCEDKSCKIKNCCELELVKVGSFYEGTRNGFPNEFDFIAVLGTVDEEPDENDYTHLFKQGFCTHCEVYKSNEYPDYSVKFRYTNVSRCHRKVTRLEYVYTRGQEEMIIDVDIVIALRCYKAEQFYMVTDIFNKEFYEEMLKTGRSLFIYTGASAVLTNGRMVLQSVHIGTWKKTTTETEKRFVKDILSKPHRKVYRILKYIINGPFGGDLFRYLDDVQDFQHSLSVLIGTGFSISSYVIKNAVIYHHYACKKDREGIGNCVCEILFNIKAAFKPNFLPVVAMHSLLCSPENCLRIGRGNKYFLENIYRCLVAFTERLKSLQSSNDGLEKCNHDLENSFLEMVLRLDMFIGYETFFFNSDSKFPNQKVVWLSEPNVNKQAMVKKVKEYKEKRNKVQDCPWCDYPIPTRKL